MIIFLLGPDGIFRAHFISFILFSYALSPFSHARFICDESSTEYTFVISFNLDILGRG